MTHRQYAPWTALTTAIDSVYPGSRSALCKDPRIACAPSTLSNLEAGRRWPDAALTARLASVLGVLVTDIARHPNERLVADLEPDGDPLTARTGLSASERSMRAKRAANIRWALTEDRTAATAPARAGRQAKFEEQVDPDRTLTPVERRRRANNLRKAAMQQMVFKAALKRRTEAEGAAS